ncbi:DUF1175 domain-containing protein [Geothrix campi]|uniref:DUF1175 domain-containing protein n=1 Tax=Geothrix campi TaxID=2966450 RepID=UPI002149059A|nr:DUF1175 domain-containing protein [Geothrix sp. SG10]
MNSRLYLGVGAVLAASTVLVPIRHRAVLEADPANPVARIRLDSRSLAGLRLPGWGVRVVGVQAWRGPEGFFLLADGPAVAQVQAWPGFQQSLSIPASGSRNPAGLPDEGDREAFRSWFVALLEQQVEAPSPAWEPAQRDCAGLLRFAFREALAPHTAEWRSRVAFNDSAPGQDPSPALGADWRQGFPTPDGPRPFARGVFLRRLACVPLGRDTALARPGDLVFFARGGARSQPDHAMAFVRPDVDGAPMLLYHTGPEGSGLTQKPGEVRRVRLDELLHHPDPEFRPVPENPSFLGLYRWRPLAGGASEPFPPRS